MAGFAPQGRLQQRTDDRSWLLRPLLKVDGFLLAAENLNERVKQQYVRGAATPLPEDRTCGSVSGLALGPRVPGALHLQQGLRCRRFHSGRMCSPSVHPGTLLRCRLLLVWGGLNPAAPSSSSGTRTHFQCRGPRCPEPCGPGSVSALQSCGPRGGTTRVAAHAVHRSVGPSTRRRAVVGPDLRTASRYG